MFCGSRQILFGGRGGKMALLIVKVAWSKLTLKKQKTFGSKVKLWTRPCRQPARGHDPPRLVYVTITKFLFGAK